MTERIFTYTWTDAKRLTVLHALGFMYAKLAQTPTAVTEAVEGLISELSQMPGKDAPPAPMEPHGLGRSAPAHAILAPPEPTDYFERNRAGDLQVTAPKGAEFQVRKIVGTAKTAKYLKVILTHDGNGKATASCWDADLRSIIARNEGKELGLWIKVSEDGKFANIVGVRA